MGCVVLQFSREHCPSECVLPECPFPASTAAPGAPQTLSLLAGAVGCLRHHFPETAEPDTAWFNSLIMFITTPAASCAVKDVISSYWVSRPSPCFVPVGWERLSV